MESDPGVSDSEMDIKVFLEKSVEGYLFADLDSMAKFNVKGNGNCNYPMVMTVLFGIELLGTLTYPKCLGFEESNSGESCEGEAAPEVGNPQFTWYWKHFLTPANPGRYKVKGNIGELIRSLVRNGLAHAFLIKPGIEVRKFDPESHMKSSARSQLIIDSTEFAKDLKRSYWDYIRPIIDGKPAIIKGHTTSLQTMQDRLIELASSYVRDAQKSFGDLKGEIPPVPATQGPDISASFNFPPPGTV